MEQARGAIPLVVTFVGEEWEVVAPDTLSFGRTGDLVIDENPFLHRIVGRFEHRAGLWWVQNVGSRIVLEVADRASASIFTIKPGAAGPLHVASALVRFQAASVEYELEVCVGEAAEHEVRLPTLVGNATITGADLRMTPDQLRLVLSLAEPALLDPYAREPRIPANRQAAHRLGWTLTRFNRKLDNVCQKLAKLGVPGLHGDVAELAIDRRKRLVEHAIESGLVTASDLVLLDQSDP